MKHSKASTVLGEPTGPWRSGQDSLEDEHVLRLSSPGAFAVLVYAAAIGEEYLA